MATYVVGLPVAITVQDDGTVVVHVDMTEAVPAITEEYGAPEADLMAVDAYSDAHGWEVSTA